MVKKILGKYLAINNKIFNELICNLSIFQIGDDNLKTINKSTLVFPKVSSEVEIEPFPIEQLIAFKRDYPDFIMEVYHNKLVLEWQNLLDEIFNYLLDLHFHGKRQFTELGKIRVAINFADKRTEIDQIIEEIKIDYGFLSYKDRIKVIKDSFNCNSPDYENNLQNILKNVLIRNLIQHKHKIIDDYLLRTYGKAEIVMLGNDGKERTYKEGEAINIYLAEIFNFKKSTIYTINKWINDGKL